MMRIVWQSIFIVYTDTMLPMTSDMTLIDRMVLSVERVRDRLLRATAALDEAEIPYAVVDDSAVSAWVETVDESAVRYTQDVDILLKRSDLDAAEIALAGAGFIRRRVQGIEIFLDGPEAKMRDAVHIVLAGEKVRPEYEAAAPDINESERPGGFSVVALEALVRMKLTSFRRKDQVHLLDMLEAGLIDATWVGRFGAVLGARLQELIDTPDE